jgi:chromosome segregation ATPase
MSTERRMAEIESDIRELRKEVQQLTTNVALCHAAVERVGKDVAVASTERSKITSELGAFGIQLTKFVSEVASVKDAVNEIRAQAVVTQTEIQGLKTDRAVVIGVGKVAGQAGGLMGRIAIIVASGLIGAGVTIIGWIAAGRPTQ